MKGLPIVQIMARRLGTAGQLGLVTLLGLPLVTPLLRWTQVPCTHDGHLHYHRLAAMGHAWENGLHFYRYSEAELSNLLTQSGLQGRVRSLKHLPDRAGDRLGGLGLALERICAATGLGRAFASYWSVAATKGRSSCHRRWRARNA